MRSSSLRSPTQSQPHQWHVTGRVSFLPALLLSRQRLAQAPAAMHAQDMSDGSCRHGMAPNVSDATLTSTQPGSRAS